MNEKYVDREELPLGFSFALTQNPAAMQKFSNLSKAKQTDILHRAQSVTFKGEMQALVHDLETVF